MVLGEFSKGLSKEFMQMNNSIGFLIMSLDRKLWRGKARWTHLSKEGPEYQMMNEKPMFRYNAYFGINTVHYFDLQEITEREDLPLVNIGLGLLKTVIAKGGTRRKVGEILKPFALSIVDRIDSLKFLSYIGGDGFPAIIPVIQCRSADSGRLAFAASPYEEDLAAIPRGATVARICHDNADGRHTDAGYLQRHTEIPRRIAWAPWTSPGHTIPCRRSTARYILKPN